MVRDGRLQARAELFGDANEHRLARTPLTRVDEASLVRLRRLETFWVFVDLIGERPAFYICPDWWLENALYDDYQAYLGRHGGSRPENPASTHIGIKAELIAEWRDRWDLLGIFPD